MRCASTSFGCVDVCTLWQIMSPKLKNGLQSGRAQSSRAMAGFPCAVYLSMKDPSGGSATRSTVAETLRQPTSPESTPHRWTWSCSLGCGSRLLGKEAKTTIRTRSDMCQRGHRRQKALKESGGGTTQLSVDGQGHPGLRPRHRSTTVRNFQFLDMLLPRLIPTRSR